ncbi:hypothetical protein ANCCEY_09199 [Ancylostoma ceylanicum]|uniref:Uncharacterized protein n=1 Tax=Ancylostoma ceylanicum TaxID=53326 RepID=A0A0D6LI74_9BILA|nr:hypothetical protein ANCCEY_09199 [Ancylostoma ceylanicum]
MPVEAGWTKRRPVVLWVVGTHSVKRALVRHVEPLAEREALEVTLDAYGWSSNPLEEDIKKRGRLMKDGYLLDICVRLTKAPAAANSIYENISRMQVFENLETDSTASAILSHVYGAAPLGCPNRDEPQPMTDVEPRVDVLVNDNIVTFSAEHWKAVALGSSGFPIAAIQAAFGTGKTLVGAVIAAQLVDRDEIVLVTASTNAAVAQFAQTILSLSAYRHLRVLRYVSDAAVLENMAPTSGDMNKILISVHDTYTNRLSPEAMDLCNKFTIGRRILERYIENPDLALYLTDEEKEEYAIAERNVSRTLEKMIALMLTLRPPHILCITTASLMNTIGTPDGAFNAYRDKFTVLIGEEASQIPEPALTAISNRLPNLRQIYIGDIHQLEPHAKCPRDSHAAVYGARSVMSVLCSARAVPVASLVRTFRAHPALNELPNRVAYDGTLVSGITAFARPMLIRAMEFPAPGIPFMLIDVDGQSTRAENTSHFNPVEVETCVELLKARGIAPSTSA